MLSIFPRFRDAAEYIGEGGSLMKTTRKRFAHADYMRKVAASAKRAGQTEEQFAAQFVEASRAFALKTFREVVLKVKWKSITRDEHEAMQAAGFVVRKTVLRKGPQGSRFEAQDTDLLRFYAGKLCGK